MNAIADHRRERERQITDVLRGGDLGVEEITATAHLQKLERDGVVRRAGNAWHIITGRPDQV